RPGRRRGRLPGPVASAGGGGDFGGAGPRGGGADAARRRAADPGRRRAAGDRPRPGPSGPRAGARAAGLAVRRKPAPGRGRRCRRPGAGPQRARRRNGDSPVAAMSDGEVAGEDGGGERVRTPGRLITVVLADDHPIWRDGVRADLGDGFWVVAEAGNADEAV